MIVLIWIDWYPYHHARLRALLNDRRIGNRAAGIELVGRTGVHKGLVFREAAEASFPLTTLMPSTDWSAGAQLRGATLLWKELNRLNPSVVFVPGYYTLPAFAAAVWGRMKRRRTVLMTESTQHDHPRTAWKEFAKGVAIRALFDYAISGGKAHRRYLRALGFPADRMGGCYDVVDNAFYATAKESRESRSNCFLFAGRLAPEKNVAGLIDAYAAYRRKGGGWRLVLVGGGPEERVLRREAAGCGFGGDIQFAGLKNARELAVCYAQAGCFVLPSTREPWGLVVNEAMAAALPVIVSNRCGCAEDLVIDGGNGFLFDPQRAGELAAKLMDMERAGGERRAEMGRRSERIISGISPEAWAEEVERISRVGYEPGARLTMVASR
jgi:1,2-diacylglycerol 3-alpha-glucosyltransferase